MMIQPERLRKGDAVAFLTPATEIRPEYVRGAEEFFRRRGYDARVYPHAYGPRDGSFAANLDGRLTDLEEAILDPDVKLIFCNRGGYGCQQLLAARPAERWIRLVRENPKWILGFSDISALHALWNTAGVMSIHASMAKEFTEHPDGAPVAETMAILVEGAHKAPELIGEPCEYNIHGEAEGELVGGNLAVLDGLAATPFDVLSEDFLRGKILFIEDVGEKIYKVDRMLTRLAMTGALHAVAGIAIGIFTDYTPDRNYRTMEEMIADRLRLLGVRCPVAYRLPIGHIDAQLPVVCGQKYSLLSASGAKLKVKS